MFLRECVQQVAIIVLVFHVYFNIVTSEDCVRAFRQVLVEQEHGKPCVYVEKSGLRFIGWRFAINQRQQARAVFARLGADYEQFCKSPATPSEARCECSYVPCLNKRQMDKLLDLSVEGTLQNTQTLVPSLKNLCCSLKRRILLLAFKSGGKIFNDFAYSDIEYQIKMQSWLALSHRLDQTKWCKKYQYLCTEQTRSLVDGCVDNGEHRGSRDKRQISGKSKENATCAENTCRKGSTRTSMGKPSTATDIIRSATAANSFIIVKPSASGHIKLGTSAALNAGYPSEDSQFTPEPSQVPDVRIAMATDSIRGSLSTTDSPTVSSNATKSLEKDLPLRLTSRRSLQGSSQGYVYTVFTASAKTSTNVHQSSHALKTQGIPEFRFEKSSTDWSFPLTSSSKFVIETAKPSSVISSNPLKLWSLSASEAERVSLVFHRTSSVLKTGMNSSPFGLHETLLSATSVLKRPTAPLSQDLQTETTLKFVASLFSTNVASKSSPRPALPLKTLLIHQSRMSLKFSELSSSATPMIRKDWSSSLHRESGKSKQSTVVLSNLLKVSKTRSTPLSKEERESSTYSWQVEQRTVDRTSYVSKTRMISSSLASKSLFSAASGSKTVIGPELSFELTSPSQVVVFTTSSLGRTYLASQVLQTSLKVAELYSPIMSVINEDWSSSPTPIGQFGTERTRPASVIQRNPSKLSSEAKNMSLTSWPLQQTLVHLTSAVLSAEMTSCSMGPKFQISAISPSKTTNGLDLSFETLSQGPIHSVPTTSASWASSGSHLSFGTSLSAHVMQSNTFARFAESSSPTLIPKVDLSSTIKPTASLVSTQRSLASRTLFFRVSSSISKSWSIRSQQKSEPTGSSRLSKIFVTQRSRSAYFTSPEVSSSGILAYYAGSSEIREAFSSSTNNISTNVGVPSGYVESTIYDSTRFIRSSSNFASTTRGIVSRTPTTLSNTTHSSRQQTATPHNTVAIRSSVVHFSVRTSFPDKTLRVHEKESSSLLFLHTASVSSTAILDVMKTRTTQIRSIKTSQPRNTLPSVWSASTMEALSIKTLGTIASPSSLAPSPSAVPQPPPSLSLSWTTITKMMTNASSLYEKTLTTLPSVPIIGASPLASSISPVKKAISTNISGVSVTKERPYRSSQVTSSLGLTIGIPLQTSLQHVASALDHLSSSTWTEMSVALTQSLAKEQSRMPFSAAFVLSSSTSAKLPFSKSSNLRITLLPPVVPTPSGPPSFSPSELAAASSVIGSPQYDQTYLVIFSGNCTMIDNKDDFSSQFKFVLTRLLSVHAADISVLRISCGSVHVMFSIREAKGRDITNKLREIVEVKALKVEYNNMTFVALEMSDISKPSGTTARPSTTTHTSRTLKAKQIALIIFILVLSLFAALAILLGVLFCARFCRCCKTREKRQKPKKTSAEVELRVFSSLYNNLFRKVDYYGGSRQPATPSRERREEFECEDVEDAPVSTVTALLSETEKAIADEEKKFNFDDDDSCASVLFY